MVGAALVACGAATPPPGMGLVIGGIQPCRGIATPQDPRYAAGTVRVLKGEVAWRRIDAASQQAVFPEAVAAQQSVSENGTYSFALKPGHYVLRASFRAPAAVQPWIPVEVEAGQVVSADVPNMCM